MREQGWDLGWLRIVQSFLTGRRVRTRLEGKSTEFTDVLCGTPQGSPLSPVLYSLYLLELLNKDRNLRFGYADDLTFYRVGKTLDKTSEALAADMRLVMERSTENKVFFCPREMRGNTLHKETRALQPGYSSKQRAHSHTNNGGPGHGGAHGKSEEAATCDTVARHVV
ncbi:hypothetical protein ANO14919_073770 [Xylariales sp. No.14919]|nr:hypothetical protein ANO14919_073770 [Xylariales sp. No.14919]